MDIASIVKTGDMDALTSACAALRQRIAASPLTLDGLARDCSILHAIQANNAILARRINNISPVPPVPGAGQTVASLPDYLAALVDHYPYELPHPSAFFALSPAAAALITPLLTFGPTMFPGTGGPEGQVRLMEWLLPGTERYAAQNRDRADTVTLLEAVVSNCNMIPLYFADCNLAPLARVRARLTATLLQCHGKQLALDPPRRVRAQGRRRLGVFRNVFNNASEVAALRAHLLPYDRDRYEIILYALSESNDSGEARMKADFDRFVLLGDSSPDAIVRTLRAEDLDIFLMGKNVCGLNNIPWVVGAHRVAPLQIGTTLFPITTGLPTFDAYFTGRLNESPEAASQYSETLILADGAINAYDFSGPPTAHTPIGLRARLKAGDGDTIFASGANLHKITPELLAVWAEILKRTPGSRLALYPFNRNWSTSYEYGLCSSYLYDQFERNGVGRDRIALFATFEGRDAILGLLDEADIYLDSFPFSGAVSIVDPLLCDCPIVALEGTAARCRQSAGFLRGMGLDPMVASTRSGYIDLAVAMAADPGYRARLSARIRSARTPAFPANPWLAGQFWRAVEVLAARQIQTDSPGNAVFQA